MRIFNNYYRKLKGWPGGSVVKNLPANAEDTGSISGDLLEKKMATQCSILFFFSNWRLITLQYCIGLAIHWHESALGVHVFPIPIPPPASLSIPSLWVIPVHQPSALVSCIQPGLAIYFTLDNIHVSVLFSQIIPPLQYSSLGNPMDKRSLVGYSPWGTKRDRHNLANKQQQDDIAKYKNLGIPGSLFGYLH